MKVGTPNGKSQLLREAGYVYNFDRMVYVNRRTKKAFSVEFVEADAISAPRSVAVAGEVS